jgi:hypothetical protein
MENTVNTRTGNFENFVIIRETCLIRKKKKSHIYCLPLFAIKRREHLLNGFVRFRNKIVI